ncbi:MAG: DUF4032 domain-containing protein [Frankiales bacterium]|nr:DUF4032 domain-containing protein [Frankiales bacterium]
MALRVTAAAGRHDLLFLPWDVPLEEWPESTIVALPRGISRHVVRFVRLGGDVFAVKETVEPVAQHEYDLLFELGRRDIPCVEPVGIVAGRTNPDGEDLPAAIITRHLQFSLPYRALFSTTLRPDTANRLIDALAVLMVRLHLVGFAWGDCSLSNALFRRDAGAFAAYLVDAETGEIHDNLSAGQRLYDLETAELNLGGEMLDVEASGRLHPSIDPIAMARQVRERYESLWHEISAPETIGYGERHRLDARVRRLNDLGFDVAELSVVSEEGGTTVRVTPKVVDVGHHSRRLLRLTGLDVEENQARRLLNDLDTYRVELGLDAPDEEVVAHRWVAEVFEPVTGLVPAELRGKLEPAEMFHEVLEHRWFMGERLRRDVSLDEAARDYVASVLSTKPDERAVLGQRLGTPSDLTGLRFDETQPLDLSELDQLDD